MTPYSLLSIKEGNVTFRYQNSSTKQFETRTESGANFLWLLFQHVLPKGFRRARNFGFLHPNSKRLIQVIQLRFNIDINRSLRYLKKRPQWRCPCCGSRMVILETRLPPLFRISLQTSGTRPTWIEGWPWLCERNDQAIKKSAHYAEEHSRQQLDKYSSNNALVCFIVIQAMKHHGFWGSRKTANLKSPKNFKKIFSIKSRNTKTGLLQQPGSDRGSLLVPRHSHDLT